MTEIELKFYPVKPDEIRARLRDAGFELIVPEFLMTRVTFDIPARAGAWGRVRREHDKITMSIKCFGENCITGMQESELVIADFDAAVEFMRAAGMEQKGFQENYREIWTRPGTEATIDTWPGLEPLIEIEATGTDESAAIAAVHAAARDLGFNPDDAMFGSVDLVYEKVLGIPAAEICALPQATFANPPTK
ncbi:MAG: CYTH domain-containing protein [Rickettsiales bacterium]|jgi:adenylate cyclase class 2|nr:CYTH domain-containing protein [Rickettsiales bacterium]